MDDADRRMPRGVRGLTGDFPKLGAPTYAVCGATMSSPAFLADRLATDEDIATAGADDGTGTASPPTVPEVADGEARPTPASAAHPASFVADEGEAAAETAFKAVSRFVGGTSRAPCMVVPSSCA